MPWDVILGLLIRSTRQDRAAGSSSFSTVGIEAGTLWQEGKVFGKQSSTFLLISAVADPAQAEQIQKMHLIYLSCSPKQTSSYRNILASRQSIKADYGS